MLRHRKYYFLLECVSSRRSHRGLLLGCYEDGESSGIRLSDTAQKLDDSLCGRLSELIKGSDLRKGKCLVFNNLSNDYHAVALAGLGPKNAGFNEAENLDESGENIRIAAGLGVQKLQETGVNQVVVEGFSNSEAAAEGAILGAWKYEDLKNPEEQSSPVSIELIGDGDKDGWQRGVYSAEAQNIARKLSESPANLMTPSIFATNAIELLCPLGIQVDVRDKEWIEAKKMKAFMAMARGSCEPPLFMEIGYRGASNQDRPVVMVGKGVTFDSGGLCLKRCENMMESRGDMAGAAAIIGVFMAIAQMNLPINVSALIPLCENMPGSMAPKPGDVVVGMNGKSIRIENTDNDGRVIMADALTFSEKLRPKMLIDVATLTGGIRRALGSCCSGVFTTSDDIWHGLSRAGAQTGDRVWRFPLWRHFTHKVTGINAIIALKHGGHCMNGKLFNPPLVVRDRNPLKSWFCLYKGLKAPDEPLSCKNLYGELRLKATKTQNLCELYSKGGKRENSGEVTNGLRDGKGRVGFAFTNIEDAQGTIILQKSVWKVEVNRIEDSKNYNGVDVSNVGRGTGGDPCLGAAFLMEFVPSNVDFCHIDITGTGLAACGLGYPYLRKGLMTGRPTRTLIQFLHQLACPSNISGGN